MMGGTPIRRHGERRALVTERGHIAARLYRVPEAMVLLSLSRSVLYEQIRAGRLKSVTQGCTRLIPHSAIADYVALLLHEAR
jgi:excisionase family DNA binding protein